MNKLVKIVSMPRSMIYVPSKYLRVSLVHNLGDIVSSNLNGPQASLTFLERKGESWQSSS